MVFLRTDTNIFSKKNQYKRVCDYKALLSLPQNSAAVQGDKLHSFCSRDCCCSPGCWVDLKTLETFGNIVKVQSSHHLVYLNIMHKNRPVKVNLNSIWLSKLRDNNVRKKHSCHTKLSDACELENSKSNSEVSKSNSNILVIK